MEPFVTRIGDVTIERVVPRANKEPRDCIPVPSVSLAKRGGEEENISDGISVSDDLQIFLKPPLLDSLDAKSLLEHGSRENLPNPRKRHAKMSTDEEGSEEESDLEDEHGRSIHDNIDSESESETRVNLNLSEQDVRSEMCVRESEPSTSTVVGELALGDGVTLREKERDPSEVASAQSSLDITESNKRKAEATSGSVQFKKKPKVLGKDGKELQDIKMDPNKSSSSSDSDDTIEGDHKPAMERKVSNLRRNIREVMNESQLDEETLAAQRQEMERLRRVQEQQRIIREVQRQIALNRQNSKTQTRVISLLQGNSSILKQVPGSSTSPPAQVRLPNTVLVKLAPSSTNAPSTSPPSNKKVFELLRVQKGSSGRGNSPTSKSGGSMRSMLGKSRSPGQVHMMTPSVSIAPVMSSSVRNTEPTSESESEMDDSLDRDALARAAIKKVVGKPKGKDVVTISSSSDDDDCILLSEPSSGDETDPVDDPTNSGMHTNDLYNVPDEQGRVLVNVGHPPEEEDIFLAPQIARVIKPHQIGGVRFLFDNVVESLERFNTSTGFGCILAHSMGLGKTLQVVSFCDVFLRHTKARTVLCIMPINTLQNWLAEFNLWLPDKDSQNNPLAVHGEVRPRDFPLYVLNDSHKTMTARCKVIQEWGRDGGVLLIGYELYRQLSLKRAHKSKKRRKKNLDVVDIDDDDKNKALLDEIHSALVKPGPDLVICDEGHRIKNSHASISQALKQIRSKRRVVLTGYPLQNNLLEYWCMVDFVRPNYLGTKAEFCNMFERPIQNGQCIDSTPQDIRLMRYRAHVLHSLLEGFVQRRSHSVLQVSLPQKEEYVLLLRMNAFQRKLYDTFMNEVVRTKAVPNPLKAFAVCCKIWNHPDVLYYFLKKRAGGEDVDLDIEEATAASTSPSSVPVPGGVSLRGGVSKRGRGRGSRGGGLSKRDKKAFGLQVGNPGNKPAATIIPNNTNVNSDSSGIPPPNSVNRAGPNSSNQMPGMSDTNQIHTSIQQPQNQSYNAMNQNQSYNGNQNSYPNMPFQQNSMENQSQGYNNQGSYGGSGYNQSTGSGTFTGMDTHNYSGNNPVPNYGDCGESTNQTTPAPYPGNQGQVYYPPSNESNQQGEYNSYFAPASNQQQNSGGTYSCNSDNSSNYWQNNSSFYSQNNVNTSSSGTQYYGNNNNGASYGNSDESSYFMNANQSQGYGGQINSDVYQNTNSENNFLDEMRHLHGSHNSQNQLGESSSTVNNNQSNSISTNPGLVENNFPGQISNQTNTAQNQMRQSPSQQTSNSQMNNSNQISISQNQVVNSDQSLNLSGSSACQLNSQETSGITLDHNQIQNVQNHLPNTCHVSNQTHTGNSQFSDASNASNSLVSNLIPGTQNLMNKSNQGDGIKNQSPNSQNNAGNFSQIANSQNCISNNNTLSHQFSNSDPVASSQNPGVDPNQSNNALAQLNNPSNISNSQNQLASTGQLVSTSNEMVGTNQMLIPQHQIVSPNLTKPQLVTSNQISSNQDVNSESQVANHIPTSHQACGSNEVITSQDQVSHVNKSSQNEVGGADPITNLQKEMEESIHVGISNLNNVSQAFNASNQVRNSDLVHSHNQMNSPNDISDTQKQACAATLMLNPQNLVDSCNHLLDSQKCNSENESQIANSQLLDSQRCISGNESQNTDSQNLDCATNSQNQKSGENPIQNLQHLLSSSSSNSTMNSQGQMNTSSLHLPNCQSEIENFNRMTTLQKQIENHNEITNNFNQICSSNLGGNSQNLITFTNQVGYSGSLATVSESENNKSIQMTDSETERCNKDFVINPQDHMNNLNVMVGLQNEVNKPVQIADSNSQNHENVQNLQNPTTDSCQAGQNQAVGSHQSPLLLHNQMDNCNQITVSDSSSQTTLHHQMTNQTNNCECQNDHLKQSTNSASQMDIFNHRGNSQDQVCAPAQLSQSQLTDCNPLLNTQNQGTSNHAVALQNSDQSNNIQTQMSNSNQFSNTQNQTNSDQIISLQSQMETLNQVTSFHNQETTHQITNAQNRLSVSQNQMTDTSRVDTLQIPSDSSSQLASTQNQVVNSSSTVFFQNEVNSRNQICSSQNQITDLCQIGSLQNHKSSSDHISAVDNQIPATQNQVSSSTQLDCLRSQISVSEQSRDSQNQMSSLSQVADSLCQTSVCNQTVGSQTAITLPNQISDVSGQSGKPDEGCESPNQMHTGNKSDYSQTNLCSSNEISHSQNEMNNCIPVTHMQNQMGSVNHIENMHTSCTTLGRNQNPNFENVISNHTCSSEQGSSADGSHTYTCRDHTNVPTEIDKAEKKVDDGSEVNDSGNSRATAEHTLIDCINDLNNSNLTGNPDQSSSNPGTCSENSSSKQINSSQKPQENSSQVSNIQESVHSSVPNSSDLNHFPNTEVNMPSIDSMSAPQNQIGNQNGGLNLENTPSTFCNRLESPQNNRPSSTQLNPYHGQFGHSGLQGVECSNFVPGSQPYSVNGIKTDTDSLALKGGSSLHSLGTTYSHFPGEEIQGRIGQWSSGNYGHDSVKPESSEIHKDVEDSKTVPQPISQTNHFPSEANQSFDSQTSLKGSSFSESVALKMENIKCDIKSESPKPLLDYRAVSGVNISSNSKVEVGNSGELSVTCSAKLERDLQNSDFKEKPTCVPFNPSLVPLNVNSMSSNSEQKSVGNDQRDTSVRDSKCVETDCSLNKSVSIGTDATEEECKDVGCGTAGDNFRNGVDNKQFADFGINTSRGFVKEELGIPYDWATDLLKDYVPGNIENSAKMVVFFCILEESMALGDRILVFSQSLFTLNLIEDFLQRTNLPGRQEKWARNWNYYRLDGSTSALEREKLINEYNSNPNIHLFLVSTRAGSLGINLVGANRVVVFDASWNPCHDTQAVCRVYRYGQKKPCFVYRLVMDNCLEKKIYDRQINKQGMADRVVDECNPDAHLSIKEVTNLCWDNEEETEVRDFSKEKDKYIDVVMQKVLDKFSSVLSKEPFQHESLLVDRKEKKLSQAEKRLAKRSYELEKQANINYNRPQYTYYPSSGVGNPAVQPGLQIRAIRSDGPGGNIMPKPVASVRPMQAELNSQLERGPRSTVTSVNTGRTRWIPADVWQRQGMSAQEMTLPLDVVIPTNSPDRASIVLKAGQRVMVLKSPKGIYMQLENGKIIAIRTAFKVGGAGKGAAAQDQKATAALNADKADMESKLADIKKEANIHPSNRMNSKFSSMLPLKNNSAITITPKNSPVANLTRPVSMNKMMRTPTTSVKLDPNMKPWGSHGGGLGRSRSFSGKGMHQPTAEAKPYYHQAQMGRMSECYRVGSGMGNQPTAMAKPYFHHEAEPREARSTHSSLSDDTSSGAENMGNISFLHDDKDNSSLGDGEMMLKSPIPSPDYSAMMHRRDDPEHDSGMSYEDFPHHHGKDGLGYPHSMEENSRFPTDRSNFHPEASSWQSREQTSGARNFRGLSMHSDGSKVVQNSVLSDRNFQVFPEKRLNIDHRNFQLSEFTRARDISRDQQFEHSVYNSGRSSDVSREMNRQDFKRTGVNTSSSSKSSQKLYHQSFNNPQHQTIHDRNERNMDKHSISSGTGPLKSHGFSEHMKSPGNFQGNVESTRNTFVGYERGLGSNNQGSVSTVHQNKGQHKNMMGTYASSTTSHNSVEEFGRESNSKCDGDSHYEFETGRNNNDMEINSLSNHPLSNQPYHSGMSGQGTQNSQVTQNTGTPNKRGRPPKITNPNPERVSVEYSGRFEGEHQHMKSFHRNSSSNSQTSDQTVPPKSSAGGFGPNPNLVPENSQIEHSKSNSSGYQHTDNSKTGGQQNMDPSQFSGSSSYGQYANVSGQGTDYYGFNQQTSTPMAQYNNSYYDDNQYERPSDAQDQTHQTTPEKALPQNVGRSQTQQTSVHTHKKDSSQLSSTDTKEAKQDSKSSPASVREDGRNVTSPGSTSGSRSGNNSARSTPAGVNQAVSSSESLVNYSAPLSTAAPNSNSNFSPFTPGTNSTSGSAHQTPYEPMMMNSYSPGNCQYNLPGSNTSGTTNPFSPTSSNYGSPLRPAAPSTSVSPYSTPPAYSNSVGYNPNAPNQYDSEYTRASMYSAFHRPEPHHFPPGPADLGSPFLASMAPPTNPSPFGLTPHRSPHFPTSTSPTGQNPNYYPQNMYAPSPYTPRPGFAGSDPTYSVPYGTPSASGFNPFLNHHLHQHPYPSLQHPSSSTSAGTQASNTSPSQ